MCSSSINYLSNFVPVGKFIRISFDLPLISVNATEGIESCVVYIFGNDLCTDILQKMMRVGCH